MTRHNNEDRASAVPPQLYTEEYYLDCCSGADTFEASEGLAVSETLLGLFERMGVQDGAQCLDVGCGRGETAFNLAKRGAIAVGIDYADAALKLAGGMLKRHPELERRVQFVKCDAKAMPVPTGVFDAAFMLDIVEHLQPWELDLALAEVRRSLKPDGVLCVHTMPNLNYYRWVYPVLRGGARVFQGTSVPQDPRSPYERAMHVNEQTPTSVRRALQRAGFTADVWVEGMEKSPLKPGVLDRAVRAVARRPPFRNIASFHILALAR